MAEYKARRARKRASGGMAGEGKEGPPHGHMIILIGLGKKPKKKRKEGGKVEGAAARRHLGKRARGGPAKRASGGSTSGDNLGDDDFDFGDGTKRMTMGEWRPMQPMSTGTPEATKRMDTIRQDESGREIGRTRGMTQSVTPQSISPEEFEKDSRGGHVGRKRARGGPADKKISTARLEKAKEGASPAERKRITFAENARRWNK